MEIRRSASSGSATMGAGIAQVCVQAGFETVGREVDAELGERAREPIEHFLDAQRREGPAEPDERDAALGAADAHDRARRASRAATS